MKPKINSHVERLHRYLPFSPSHDQIYEEYQRVDDSLNLPTRALEYLVEAVSSRAKLVILTGDAGHGKTHLCRRLLELHFGYSQEIARELINSSCNGSSLIGRDTEKVPVRIYKDFSEMAVSIASQHIERAFDDAEVVTIICANEGRLRAVLEYGDQKQHSQFLLSRFKESFNDGLSSNDNKVHIVNLNYQSVASSQKNSFVGMAIKAWVDGKRWSACQDCSCKSSCPILRNRQQLSTRESLKAINRQKRIDLVFATVERLGTVITIREILMTISYLLTGGLTCPDVHKFVRRKSKNGWQHRYAFYNTLFEAPPELNSDKLKKISVLTHCYQLDPGRRSIREIDEKLINEQGIFESNSLDLKFVYGKIDIDAANGIDEVIGDPKNRKERSIEADFVQTVVRALRRKFFFEDSVSNQMEQLGFEYGDEFIEILEDGTMTASRMKTIKNRIVSGLHTIQGLQMGGKETTLHIVDPSFTTTGGHAAIIAKRIPTTSIKVLPMDKAWDISKDKLSRRISSSVDWLDRYLVLKIEKEDREPSEFPINLMVFDCIARASSGYVAEEFYAHDLRRIKTFLGSLTRQQSAENGDISLFIQGKLRSVSIDEGVIQVGGSL
ncbi:ATP-binding protein [Vibrio natriegens]|uniref:ATP-binding protein n=1 Tax=Vibrio natriegens TaxID=691 RepID=UPI001EFCDADF|nr:ATP-binding protein [Vibrio natriegens]MCG9703217.1 ATP-binding protein [Vibrio natriegens]